LRDLDPEPLLFLLLGLRDLDFLLFLDLDFLDFLDFLDLDLLDFLLFLDLRDLDFLLLLGVRERLDFLLFLDLREDFDFLLLLDLRDDFDRRLAFTLRFKSFTISAEIFFKHFFLVLLLTVLDFFIAFLRQDSYAFSYFFKVVDLLRDCGIFIIKKKKK
jgi:hypothetical protein